MKNSSKTQPDKVVWSTGEAGGVYVAIRISKGVRYVVLNDGRGRYLVVPISIAAQLASGIDTAIEHIEKERGP